MTAVRAAMQCVVVMCVVVMSPVWAAAQEGDQPAETKKAEKAEKKKAEKKKKGGKKKAGKKADQKAAQRGAAGEAEAEAGAEAGEPGQAAAAEGDVPPPSDAPLGAEENPKAPVTEFDEVSQPKVEARASAPPRPAEYPIERALRPITLPRRMTEVTLDAPNSFNPYVQSGVLGARHGITDEIQAGLRYGTGTLYDGDYFAGKAVSIDAEYQLFPWLAGQLSVPMLVDPYSVGVTIGAPMKFTVLERLRFDLLRDFVTFKLSRFAPSVTDAAFNDRQAEADDTNSVIEDGQINLNAGASWQLQPQIAIEGRFGIRAPDFEFQSDSPTALDVGLIYSGSNKIDIGGRLGFADLNHTDETFGLWLLAALRI